MNDSDTTRIQQNTPFPIGMFYFVNLTFLWDICCECKRFALWNICWVGSRCLLWCSALRIQSFVFLLYAQKNTTFNDNFQLWWWSIVWYWNVTHPVRYHSATQFQIHSIFLADFVFFLYQIIFYMQFCHLSRHWHTVLARWCQTHTYEK